MTRAQAPLVQPPRYRLPVAEVVAETAAASSFVLAVPPEHVGRFAYRPGQFLTVRVPLPDGRQVARCYSLSSSPDGAAGLLTITVKRMAGGEASNWLCDHVAAGDILEVLAPAGMFTPRSLDDDYLLLAAGSGITPVMSIVRSVLTGGSGRIALVYANGDAASVIFAAELRKLTAAHPGRLTVVHWLEVLSGLPSATALGPLVAPYADREAFLCGPAPFMAEAEQALRALGVPHGRLHIERFRSLPEDPFLAPGEATEDAVPPEAELDGVTLEVELDGARHTLAWPAATRMLDVLANHGLSAPSSCRQGLCGACACRIEAGEVAMVHNEVLDAEDLADGLVLACQALPRTETVRITYS